jgi:nuclear RNA export factor
MAFDNQRSALIDVYDPSSTFSFSGNTSIPERAKLQGLQHRLPNQKALDWKPWLTTQEGGSRNLSRLQQQADKLEKRLHIGGEAIVKAISVLPMTRHDITGPPELFCVDAFPVQHGGQWVLLVTLHGQFTERKLLDPFYSLNAHIHIWQYHPKGYDPLIELLSCWLLQKTLGMSPLPYPGIKLMSLYRAKMAGWDVIILSDQWTIRGYSLSDAWKSGPMIVQSQSRTQRPRHQAQQPSQSMTPHQQLQLQLQQLGLPIPPDQQDQLLLMVRPALP